MDADSTGDKQILRTTNNAPALFSDVNLTSSLDVIHNGSGTLTFGGQTIIKGTGTGINKSGTGTLQLDGSNTYTGATNVTGGTLNLRHATDTLSSSSAVTVDGATAVLSIAGNSDTVGAVSLKNGGSITGSGGTLTGASYAVESGSVSAILGGAGIALTKSTAGTVTLTGANTYSGTTTVSAGALEVNNTTGSGTGSGTVTVDSTLKGDGSITAAANNFVYINGTLQVGQTGATVGQDFSLTTSGAGSTIFGVSSFLSLDLWTTTAADQSGTLAAADMLRLFGKIDITSGATLKLINPNALTFQAGDMFRVFDWTGVGTRTGSFTEDFGAITLAPGASIDSSNLYTTGTISIIAIPEPSRALLMMLGLAGLVTRRRRC
ncbi:MAG: autotransporter-associated beta strand repeat-containing protein [Verrucomicrobiaceae bacterium]|nr:autotransporter-associated beta strand repeat-containing protein [Verrucomicrobiaceae bacterium]